MQKTRASNSPDRNSLELKCGEIGPSDRSKMVADGCNQIQDAELEISGSSGHDLGAFNPDEYLQALQTSVYGRLLLSAHTITSTQLLMLENRKIMPQGTVCVTDVQQQGKGRGGNVWTSPEGCLMASVAINTSIAGTQVPFTQYVACLAVISALQELMSEKHGLSTTKEAFPFRIKWPNDIYALWGDPQKPLKVGGILCNSMITGKDFSVIVGIGLNVSNKEPTVCVNDIISAATHGNGGSSAQPPLDREILLATIMNHFEEFQSVLEQEGFDGLESTYRRYWLHENQRLLVGDSQIPMTVRGLSKSGYLRAQDDAGEEFELHPDGNSLDMMKGMISRKPVH